MFCEGLFLGLFFTFLLSSIFVVSVVNADNYVIGCHPINGGYTAVEVFLSLLVLPPNMLWALVLREN